MNSIRLIRGTILGAVAGADDIVRCRVAGLEGEEIDDVDILGAYGFDGVPVDGTECIALQTEVGTVVIAMANETIAPGGSAGDVVIHTSKEQYITVKASGGVDIKTAGAVTIDAPTINLGGSSGLRALLDERFVTAFNAHTHTVSGAATLVPLNPVATLAVSTSVVGGK